MDDRPARRRLGCWGWLLIAVGLLAGLVMTTAFWLQSNADLDGEMARAKTLGLATTWEELGLPSATPADQRAMAGLSALCSRAKLTGASGNDLQEPRSPFDAASGELQTWDSGIDVPLDALIDGLSAKPCWSIDPDAIREHVRLGNAVQTLDSIVPGGWDQRTAICTVFSLRSAQGRTGEQRLGDLLVRLIQTPPTGSIVGVMTSGQLTHVWINHVLRHRSSLDAFKTAQTARELADQLDAQLLLVMRVQPLSWDASLRLSAESLFRAWNLGLPALMRYDVTRRLCYRFGRRPILARFIDASAWIAGHGLPKNTGDVSAACPHREVFSWQNAHRTTLSLMLEDPSCGFSVHGSRETWLHGILMAHLRRNIYLRLIAADLEGSSWPADPQDSTGGPLRPIMRDGVVIGAYSLGQDGVDNGGSVQSDWCWPLRAQLGYPKASDPPKAP